MANNVTIPTTGSGDATPKVATEQIAVTLEHKQIVELAVPGTALNTISADTANGLDVDVTRVQGTVSARANDGTNSETTLFDADSGAGTQYVRGVSVRLSASGGSVEGGTNTNPIAVALASASTATESNVVSSATNVTLLASNAARKMATFFNDSTQLLYLKLGVTASATSYTVQMQSNAYYELPRPIYTGQIDGIWASANGNARVTEY